MPFVLNFRQVPLHYLPRHGMGLLLEYSILSRLSLLSVSVRGFLNGPELQTHPVLPENTGQLETFCIFRGLGGASEGQYHPRGSL